MRKKSRRSNSTRPPPKTNDEFTPMSDEEEEKEIIKMLDARVPTNKIAKVRHVSVTRIVEINKRRKESRKPRQKSISSDAFKLFKDGKSALDVAIELGIEGDEVEIYWHQYLHLANIAELTKIYSETGTDLSDFLAFFHDMKVKGLTFEHLIELRNVSNNIHELSQTQINLTNQVVNLQNLVASLSQQRDQLNIQIQNVNSELALKNSQYHELTLQISNLKSILDSITQGNITYEKIQQIANNVAMSLIASRKEFLILALGSTIMTLQRDPTLAALFLAPVQGIQNPGLRDRAGVIFMLDQYVIKCEDSWPWHCHTGSYFYCNDHSNNRSIPSSVC
ncbi:MAG: hypothetical protein ABJB85_03240 [Nitrososphaerota archaeon]